MYCRSCLIWIFFCCLLPAQAQNFLTASKKGFPLITNYTPKEYQAHEQIWASVQGKDKRMYFANGDGLLVYDNEHWEMVSLTNKSHVRSMGISSDSTLYLGGDGEIGYIHTNEYGRVQYHSLVDQLPEKERTFSRVWTTVEINNRMYFQTYERMFIWDGKKFEVHSLPAKVWRTYFVNGTLYGSMENKGLVRWENNHFQQLPYGESFVGSTIRMILPFSGSRLLVGTEDGNLSLYDQTSVQPFHNDASADLKQYEIRSGSWLDSEHMAIGSNGLFIINRAGKLVLSLDKASGLFSEQILHTYTDNQQNLWLGTQAGISKVSLGMNLSLIDQRSGLSGSIEQIVSHQGQLVVASKEGLFFEESDHPVFRKFSKATIFQDRVWDLYSHPGSLLIGSSDGLFEWTDGRFTQLNDYNIAASLCASAHKDLVWASTNEGCVALLHENGKWQEVGKKEKLTGSIRYIVEYKPGEVWLGSRAQGVYRLTYPLHSNIPDVSKGTITQFSVSAGLPPGDAIPFVIAGRLYVMVGTDKLLYTFDQTQEKFVATTDMSALFGLENRKIYPMYSEESGRKLWLRSIDPVSGANQLIQAEWQSGGSYHTKNFTIPAYLSSFEKILLVANNQAFFGGLDGILCQELHESADVETTPVQPILTAVTLQQQPLDFLANGRQLTYEQNAQLRFSFSAPFFSITDQIRYQTKLIGFEDKWSGWSKEPFKEYTHLWEGSYELQVRAINDFGQVSQIASWSFVVSPPWYRQLWIYGAYVLCFISLVYGIATWRSLRLEKENLRLEQTVEQRTAEIASQRNQLQEQSEKLKSLDALKSRFFANISHEFRTPLTLITGLIKKYQKHEFSDPQQEDYRIILHNAHRLLRLINQLLELSKLEAGNTRLAARETDMTGFLQRIIFSFAFLASQKNITFTFNKKPLSAASSLMPVKLYVDPEKMEQVVINLVANAIKYTPLQGKVDVSLEITSNRFHILVHNTGPGIAPETLPYVFDRFFQASENGYYEGTGIGLALVKELVERHQGNVSVESVPEVFTLFTVSLPMGKAHLSADDLARIDLTDIPLEDNPLNETLLVPVHPPESSPKTLADTSKPMVLVVEDHPELRNYICEQLQSLYQVQQAEDGEAGWKLAEEMLPDLVLSDVMMPRRNGLELCTLLKTNEKTSHIPVILLTARASQDNKLEGLETGADDYLIKPFDARELLLRIENLIKSRQQLREKFSAQVLLEPSRVSMPSQQQAFLEKLHLVLEKYLDDELFGVEKLGEELGMSRSQVHRKVKAITNQAPSDLIRAYRLQRAGEMIRKDIGNLSEIAYQTGFSSLSHFSRSFHEAYGCSPSEYKKKYQSSPS
ncbi:response regulator [Rhodocytophaga rosea]|uniref:histidine kinase n=1 Tax=Rhodocytophaga rosea TaxID=2704465 RepID=A0A6C0GJB1_9BACT|nr:response regulator [Rhodocytophaga rosea]QHT68065.1 response regulator [Rhodocytophaga rosea]